MPDRLRTISASLRNGVSLGFVMHAGVPALAVLAAACAGPAEREPSSAGALPVFGLGGNAGSTASATAGAAGVPLASGGAAGIDGSGSGAVGSGAAGNLVPAAGGSGGAGSSESNAGSGGTGDPTGNSIVENGGFIGALCPAGSALCEDFEDDELARAPLAPWEESTNGASARVDEVRAFSGGQALLINVPSGPPPHRGYMAVHQNNFPAATRNMYGRMMVWLEATPLNSSAGASLHWTLFQGEGRAATNNYNAIYRFGGEQQGGSGLMANYETTQDGNPPVRSNCYQHSAERMPVQRWACIEWHLAGDNNEAQYWIDGADLSDIHVVDQSQACQYDEPPLNGQWLAPPAFQTLYVGWEQYQPSTNPVNVWLDDIVVATSRVGCPDPG